jgi:intracellular sulfur oxidation DsrE/DsrF family protein
MSSSSTPHDRRAFLGRAAATAAAAAGLGVAPASLLAAAAPAPPAGAAKPDDAWLDGLKGKHRQIFDMPQPAGGLPMIHVRNFLDTYKSAYGLGYPDVNAVVGLYGFTVPLALTDELWEKYELGKAISQVDDETKAPAVRNVFWKPRGDAQTIPVAGGPIVPPRDTAMTELQKRGALYIVCNNAMNFWAGRIAGASGQTPAAVRAEMDAHLVPGVVVVPAMVIAISKAQERGLSYMFLP